MTLKQALRGMSVSQTSELASLKRLSKPPVASQLADVGAIKQRYRAIVFYPGLEPSTSKHITWTRGTSHELEGGILKSSLRGTDASQTSESCSLKLSSLIGTQLSSVTSSSEAGSSRTNERANMQGNEDALVTSWHVSNSLDAESSINNTDIVRVTITNKTSNNGEISVDNGSETKSNMRKNMQGSKCSDTTSRMHPCPISKCRVVTERLGTGCMSH